MATNKSENPIHEGQLDPNELLARFKNTNLYNCMMQGARISDEYSNNLAIRVLLRTQLALNPIVNFVNGNYKKTTAFELFRNETATLLSNFRNINSFFETLFDELVEILLAIKTAATETNEKAAAVLTDEKPVEEKQEKRIIGIEKDKPEVISNAEEIKITIVREEMNGTHVIIVRNNNSNLSITCPTSDSEKGKDAQIEVRKGEEYAIGMANTKLIEIVTTEYKAELQKLDKAQHVHYEHHSFCSVSEETKDALETIKSIKAKIAKLKATLDNLKSNPLLLWFDKKKSGDISSQHIIVHFETKDSIVITDEGEKGAAVLEIQ